MSLRVLRSCIDSLHWPLGLSLIILCHFHGTSSLQLSRYISNTPHSISQNRLRLLAKSFQFSQSFSAVECLYTSTATFVMMTRPPPHCFCTRSRSHRRRLAGRARATEVRIHIRSLWSCTVQSCKGFGVPIHVVALALKHLWPLILFRRW